MVRASLQLPPKFKVCMATTIERLEQQWQFLPQARRKPGQNRLQPRTGPACRWRFPAHSHCTMQLQSYVYRSPDPQACRVANWGPMQGKGSMTLCHRNKGSSPGSEGRAEHAYAVPVISCHHSLQPPLLRHRHQQTAVHVRKFETGAESRPKLRLWGRKAWERVRIEPKVS